MKKTAFLFLILISILTVSGQASDKNLRFSSNKMTDGAIVTCLAGFHTGDNKISNNADQDAVGFLASLSVEFPISISSAFLINVDYDQISFTPDIKEGYKWKTTQSVLSVTSGVRFFIGGD